MRKGLVAAVLAVAVAAVWFSWDPVDRRGRVVGDLPLRMLDGGPVFEAGKPAVVHLWLPA